MHPTPASVPGSPHHSAIGYSSLFLSGTHEGPLCGGGGSFSSDHREEGPGAPGENQFEPGRAGHLSPFASNLGL